MKCWKYNLILNGVWKLANHCIQNINADVSLSARSSNCFTTLRTFHDEIVSTVIANRPMFGLVCFHYLSSKLKFIVMFLRISFTMSRHCWHTHPEAHLHPSDLYHPCIYCTDWWHGVGVCSLLASLSYCFSLHLHTILISR